MVWISVLVDATDYWELVNYEGGPCYVSEMNMYDEKGGKIKSVMVHDLGLEHPVRGWPK